MRYFFVIHLGHIGSQVMLRGARIALRDGRLRSASNLLTMSVGLAHRSQERINITDAMVLMGELSSKSDDPGILGNVALCRAIAGSLQSNNDIVHEQALSAIEHFKESLSSASKSSDANSDIESIENDLSSSYGLLGDALLARRQFASASNAYRSSLDLVRGQSIAVNVGQLQHQIGNCEVYLGNLSEAAHRYTEAAKQFHAIGMRGYLGNALSEFGHLLLEFDAESALPGMPSEEVIEAGVEDVSSNIEGAFGQYPFDLGVCSTALRNLFGLLVLISLSKEGRNKVFPEFLDSVVTRCGMMALFATAARLRCLRRFIDTTYPTGTGPCLSPIYQDEPGFGAELRRTTADSSTPCSGFFAPAPRGETCRPRMAGGKTPIGGFAAGVIRAFGSHCWSSSSRSPISNGS
jgi:hypothetical protein